MKPHSALKEMAPAMIICEQKSFIKPNNITEKMSLN